MTDFTDDLAVETSAVRFKLVDPLGRPISDLKYEVRQLGKAVASGATDSEGDAAQFQAAIGYSMSISVQRFLTTEMKVIREVTPWTSVFPIILVGGKVLETTATTPLDGSPGDYRRKTYVVKASDTLDTVARQQGCDVQELAQLNEIAGDATLSEGQILKTPVPLDAGSSSRSESASPPPDQSDGSTRSDDSNQAANSQDAEALLTATPSDAPAATPVMAGSPTAAHLSTTAAPAPNPASSPQPPSSPHATSTSHAAAVDHAASATSPTASTTSHGASALSHATSAPSHAPAPGPEQSGFEIVMSKIGSMWTSITNGVRGISGSPQSVAALKCPGACLTVGAKGLLVEEINIRLTGFGGTLLAPAPMDEFTAKTEAAVKQFQRDFMKVPDTGKVCGAFLVALDKFGDLYPIDFDRLRCQCRRCGGFGSGITSSATVGIFLDPPHNKKPIDGTERPGLHRAILWAMRASMHYTLVVDADLEYKFHNVSSSYRCWKDNADPSLHTDHKIRHTINHMGDALDVQFTKGKSTVRCAGADVDNLRAKVFIKRMGAQMLWPHANMVSLENAALGASTWVHMDVRMYDEQYKHPRFYAVTKATFEGDRVVEIAKRDSRLALAACAGLSPADSPVGPPKGTNTPSSAGGRKAAFVPAGAKSAPAGGKTAGTNAPARPASTPTPGAVQPIAKERSAIASLGISPAGVQFIRDFEKCGLKPYDDNNGFATIGWGHLIVRKSCAAAKDDPAYQDFKNGIDQPEADSMFKRDVGKIETLVHARVQVPMFQHEYDALVSLIFNMGGFDKCPRLLSKLNTKDYDGCRMEFSDITNHGNAGLIVRRKAEMNIFLSSLYNSKH